MGYSFDVTTHRILEMEDEFCERILKLITNYQGRFDSYVMVKNKANRVSMIDAA